MSLKELADVLADEASKDGPAAGLCRAALDTIEARGWEDHRYRPLIDYVPPQGHVLPSDEPAWLGRVVAAIERGEAALVGSRSDDPALSVAVFYAALRDRVSAFRPPIPAAWQGGRPGLSEPFTVPALFVSHLAEILDAELRCWHADSYSDGWGLAPELREFAACLREQLRPGGDAQVRVLLYECAIDHLRDEIWHWARECAGTAVELDAVARVLAALDRVAPVPEALAAA